MFISLIIVSTFVHVAPGEQPLDTPGLLKEEQGVEESQQPGVVPAEDAAERASNPYTAKEVCGSGYYVQERHRLVGATVYLLYDGSQNCVVTIKTASVGTRTFTTADLHVKDGPVSFDAGQYKYYAGPVKLPARGKCVKWGGTHEGDTWYSPDWSHCG